MMKCIAFIGTSSVNIFHAATKYDESIGPESASMDSVNILMIGNHFEWGVRCSFGDDGLLYSADIRNVEFQRDVIRLFSIIAFAYLTWKKHNFKVDGRTGASAI